MNTATKRGIDAAKTASKRVLQKLTWSKNCVLTSKATREAVAGDNTVAGINNPTSATFKITDIKLHVPVVTL